MDGARGSGAQKWPIPLMNGSNTSKKLKRYCYLLCSTDKRSLDRKWTVSQVTLSGISQKRANIQTMWKRIPQPWWPRWWYVFCREADVSIRSLLVLPWQSTAEITQRVDGYLLQVCWSWTPLLLNIPPNKEGKFADADVARLKEFKATLDQMYATDFAKGATVTASSTRQNHPL